MNTDQLHGAPASALTATTLEHLSAQLNARTWEEVSAGIPAWHPRMEDLPDDEQSEPESAPEDGTTEQEPEQNELPFKLDDIGEDFTLTGEQARQWLLTRQAQLQAPVTRTQQELAQERTSLAALAELKKQLENPATSMEALQALAKEAKVELEFDTEEDPEPDVPDDPLEAEVAELRAWREQQEAAAQAAQEQARVSEAEARFNQHAVDEMNRIAADLKIDGGLENMPAEDRSDIVARALTAPKRPDGLPDFDAGLAAHLKYKEHVAAIERQKYAESKQVQNPGVNGSSGTRVTDLRDVQARIAAGAKAADRHYIKQ